MLLLYWFAHGNFARPAWAQEESQAVAQPEAEASEQAQAAPPQSEASPANGSVGGPQAAESSSEAGTASPRSAPYPVPYDKTVAVKLKEAGDVPKREAEAVQLEDVVVTATKREKSVRKIPSSINALNGAALEQIGARDMTDFLNLVPGITMQEGLTANGRKISIRGVGPGDGANQTTGTLIGDVPLTDPYSAYVIPDFDPFDLKTVEILKGPQGTLFGASALNGAIRYVPNKPTLGIWEGKLFADWLSVEEGGAAPSFGAALNAPIGDEEKIAVRVAGVIQQAPGVYDNLQRGAEDSDERDKWMWRGMATWEATDRLSLTGAYLRQRSESRDLSFADNQDQRLERNNTPGPSTVISAFDVASLDARYAFDWATLVSLTARLSKLQDSDIDGSNTLPQLPIPGLQTLRAFAYADIEGYVQELRLVSPDDGRWSWIAGAFYSDYEADLIIDLYVPVPLNLDPVLDVLNPLVDLLQPILPALPDLDGLISNRGIFLLHSATHPLKATEEALFGEITRKFGERLALTLGGRYYRTELGGTANLSGLLVPVLRPGNLSTSDPHSLEGSGFSPKFAATFQATRNFLAYASASKGFQFGGVNLLPAISPNESTPATYDSSTIWNYELGVRTDWFDRTLQFDLTGFLLDWKDPQIQQLTSSGLTSYIDNVGAARSKGVETTIRYLTPIRGLSLNAAASYIIAKTAEVYTASDGTVIPEGTEMPAAPKLQTTATLAYNHLFGPWLAGASLTHSHIGKAFNNIKHQHEIYGYETLDLRLSVARPDLRFRPALTFAVTNLEDERGLASLTSSSFVPGSSESFSAFYIRPRTISARLTAEF
jgi:outer membrane receptor protein involved in Fe transport